MSARKIKQMLAKKGYAPTDVYYERSCPVPEGYASGYTLEFSDETEEAVFEITNQLNFFETHMEFDTFDDVCRFIEELPDLN